jgi:hypothetical protein
VIPIGPTTRQQRLVRVVRRSEHDYQERDLGAVLFAPLIGAEGWPEDLEARPARRSSRQAVPHLIRESAERIEDIETASIGSLLERVGDSRRIEYSAQDGDAFVDAFQNARLVAEAERYYRIMYLLALPSNR